MLCNFLHIEHAALRKQKIEGDKAVGTAIIRRAVEAPLRTLADNAGQEGALIVQEVKKRKGNEGYNVATGNNEDLVKAGVVDPTKVTRSALQNAASISGLLLTTREQGVASKHLTFETDGTRSQRHAHEDSAVVEAPPAV